jgi:ATP-dependent Lon protease
MVGEYKKFNFCHAVTPSRLSRFLYFCTLIFDIMNENFGNDVNFIPLFSLEDEEKLRKEKVNEVIPILPLMNTVLFPGMVIPITVGRSKSIKLAQEHSRSNQAIGVITHKDNELEEPAKADLYAVGTMARIIKFLTMPDGSVTIIVQGIKRFELLEIIDTEPFYRARVCEYITHDYTPELSNNQDFQALIGSIRDTAISMIRISPNLPREATYMLQNIESPAFLMNFIASNLSVSVEERQSILELRDIEERGKVVLKLLNKDLQMLELKSQIQNKSREEMDKQSREYMLHQQMKTIQQELGGSPAEKDTKQLEERAKAKNGTTKPKRFLSVN